MPVDQQVILDEILQLLPKLAKREKILPIIREKYQMHPRTFDRYWKDAKEIFEVEQKRIAKAVYEQRLADGLEQAKTAAISKESAIKELWDDFEKLRKMKAGASVPIFNEKNEVTGYMNASHFDEVRAVQGRAAIVKQIAELEGWAPLPEAPAVSILNNNTVQQNNTTVVQRNINFGIRRTTIQPQEIQEEPEA